MQEITPVNKYPYQSSTKYFQNPRKQLRLPAAEVTSENVTLLPGTYNEGTALMQYTGASNTDKVAPYKAGTADTRPFGICPSHMGELTAEVNRDIYVGGRFSGTAVEDVDGNELTANDRYLFRIIGITVESDYSIQPTE